MSDVLDPSTTPWDDVERDFRAGVLSIVAICAKYSISRSTFEDHRNKNGWVRDLGSAIRTRAEEIVLESAAKDGDAIDAAAANAARVVLSHRKDIASARQTVEKLTVLLHRAVDGDIYQPDPDNPGEPLRNDQGVPIVDTRISYLMGRSNLPEVIEKMAIAMGRLIAIERTALGLDAPSAPGGAAIKVNANDPAANGGPSVMVYLPDNGRAKDPIE